MGKKAFSMLLALLCLPALLLGCTQKQSSSASAVSSVPEVSGEPQSAVVSVAQPSSQPESSGPSFSERMAELTPKGDYTLNTLAYCVPPDAAWTVGSASETYHGYTSELNLHTTFHFTDITTAYEGAPTTATLQQWVGRRNETEDITVHSVEWTSFKGYPCIQALVGQRMNKDNPEATVQYMEYEFTVVLVEDALYELCLATPWGLDNYRKHYQPVLDSVEFQLEGAQEAE